MDSCRFIRGWERVLDGDGNRAAQLAFARSRLKRISREVVSPTVSGEGRNSCSAPMHSGSVFRDHICSEMYEAFPMLGISTIRVCNRNPPEQ